MTNGLRVNDYAPVGERPSDIIRGRVGQTIAGVGSILGITITGTPADGQLLEYDAATDTWVFVDASTLGDFPWTDGNALGAVGDDSTNNDTAFAAILAAVPAGGTVFLRDGTYRFATTWTWTKSFRLLGAASHPEPNGATPASVVLKMMTNNTTAIAQSSSSVLSAIENIEILNNGTHTSNRGIYVLGYIRTLNVYVKGFYDGLFIDGISGGPYFCDIDASSFDFNTRAGIYIDGNANNLRIHGGQVADNAYGIYMSGGSSGITIEEVNVEVYTSAGIYIDGANGGTDNVTIRDLWVDQVSGTGTYGLYLGASAVVKNVVLENCYFSTNIAAATHVRVNYVSALAILGGHYMNGLGTVVSLLCDATNTSSVLLLNPDMGGAVTTPATTRWLDATNVTPASVAGANAVGTSKYLARADHAHAGVTSVGLTVPAEFSVSGSPITGAGTLAVTSANENANTVWAGPASGAATTPAFRALVAADIPSNAAGSDHEHINAVEYNGDGATLAFELPAAPFDAYSVVASVAGVIQDVTLSGTMLTTMTFASAPGAGTNNVRVDIVALAV